MDSRTLSLSSFFLLLLFVVAVFVIVYILGFYMQTRYIQNVLTKNGFYIFEFERSLKNYTRMLIKYNLSHQFSQGYHHYFTKIQARTLKNKSLLIVQEEMSAFPYTALVTVFRNPKCQFPAFKLSKNPSDVLHVQKNIDHRNITNYYTIYSKNEELLLPRLQTYRMKKHYNKLVNRIFEIEYSETVQTLTIKASRYNTSFSSVLHFLLDLNEEIEDYKKPEDTAQMAHHVEKSKENEEAFKNSIKIFNSISLINISTLKINCIICWSKIDYSTETLLFECCSGYTHLDHGIDWLKEKEKCPKCGQSHPYTIQLPSIIND